MRDKEDEVTWFLFLETIRIGVPELRPVGETLKEDEDSRIAQGSGQCLALLLHPPPIPSPFPRIMGWDPFLSFPGPNLGLLWCFAEPAEQMKSSCLRLPRR